MLEGTYFENIRIWDVLDILIVVYLMYRIYKLLRGSIAFNIFIGVVIFYATYWVVTVLEMKLLSIALDKFVDVGVLIIVIIFQPEVRRFLLMIGNTTTRGRFPFLNNLFGNTVGKDATAEKSQLQISKAIRWMSEHKMGALIVISDNLLWQNIASTGTAVNADVSSSLIENIFFKNSPLHDGAMIISGDQILAASCVLPVSDSAEISSDLGLRHRAAIGVTESAGVLSIVVSEETGALAYAADGKLHVDVDPTEMDRIILKRLKLY